MMVPMQASNDLAMEKGCWAKLYDKKNFQGDSLLLVGPINLARMLGPFGVNWENKVRSIETGPRTNLTIFDNRNFGDEDKFIEPNVKIPDLSRKMGFFDNFRSLMLSSVYSLVQDQRLTKGGVYLRDRYKCRACSTSPKIFGPANVDCRTRFLLNRESLPANAQALKAGMSRERRA